MVHTRWAVLLLAFAAGVVGAQVEPNGDTVNATRNLRTAESADVGNPLAPNIAGVHCPDGFIAAARTSIFEYPPGLADNLKNEHEDLLPASLYAGYNAFAFDVPTVGYWTGVQLQVVCVRKKVSSVDPIIVSADFTAAPGAGFVSAFAQCPNGYQAMGGLAGFPMRDGQVIEETANSQLSDPFFLLPGVVARLWDAYARCLRSACRLIIQAVCGQIDALSLFLHKRLPIGAGREQSGLKKVVAKSAVAAGATGSVSVSCPAGSVSTAGGYVMTDPTTLKLIALTPDTAGTPYTARPDGAHEAPSGWTATFLNTGAFPNQIGATAI